jgi:hypothetical protein
MPSEQSTQLLPDLWHLRQYVLHLEDVNDTQRLSPELQARFWIAVTLRLDAGAGEMRPRLARSLETPFASSAGRSRASRPVTFSTSALGDGRESMR